MNYLLVFWVTHEGATIFLLKNAVASEVRVIEKMIDVRCEKEKEKQVREFMSACYKSDRYEHNPNDANLSGCTRLVNFHV